MGNTAFLRFFAVFNVQVTASHCLSVYTLEFVSFIIMTVIVKTMTTTTMVFYHKVYLKNITDEVESDLHRIKRDQFSGQSNNSQGRAQSQYVLLCTKPMAHTVTQKLRP